MIFRERERERERKNRERKRKNGERDLLAGLPDVFGKKSSNLRFKYIERKINLKCSLSNVKIVSK